MTRMRIAIAVVVSLFVVPSLALHADVRSDQKSKVEFAGALGRVVNIFGGKAAREGVNISHIVKGNRMASITGNSEQIVDLDEEKVYDIDLKKKTYKVTTFDELRRQMMADQQRASDRAKKEPDAEPSRPAADEKQMDVDFNVKQTGQTKRINGFDTHEAIMTITLREKGKTLEQGGGMVLTSDLWLAPPIPEMKEIGQFQIRYAEKLAGPMLAGVSPQQMSAAIASYPLMKLAISRMAVEDEKLDGTAVETVTTYDSVKSADEMAEEAKTEKENDQPSASGGVGGLLGGFARRAVRKKEAAPSPRSTVMTTTTEVLKVATTVAPSDVAVPAGFKETK
jgi:hypothetical protein